MTPTNLQTVILDGGIYWNNFFNGRLLSGEDLSKEQADNLEGRQRLGRAIGNGVACGLSVSRTLTSPPNTTTVTITKGLAINRQGQTLTLAQDIDLTLAPPSDPSTGTAATFGVCNPTQPGVYIAGAGVYLLTIAPAAGSDGKAPVSGLGNIAATCNTRYTVEGVQFRLISLNSALTDEIKDPAHLRNRVAYRCFGVNDAGLSGFVGNPFGPPVQTYGLLDSMRPDKLTDCDVPLAVIYWTAGGIQFVDMWSVRRCVTRPDADTDWIPVLSNRRESEVGVMFLQFQAQVEEMRVNEPNLASIAATARFQFLPPLGLLPIVGANSPMGFDPQVFFGALASRDVALMDGNGLRSLMHESHYHDPIDLSQPETIQLYEVWESVQAVQAGTGTQLTLLFASHTLPYAGRARFGYARWNRSRFAPAVI